MTAALYWHGLTFAAGAALGLVLMLAALRWRRRPSYADTIDPSVSLRAYQCDRCAARFMAPRHEAGIESILFVEVLCPNCRPTTREQDGAGGARAVRPAPGIEWPTPEQHALVWGANGRTGQGRGTEASTAPAPRPCPTCPLALGFWAYFACHRCMRPALPPGSCYGYTVQLGKQQGANDLYVLRMHGRSVVLVVRRTAAFCPYVDLLRFLVQADQQSRLATSRRVRAMYSRFVATPKESDELFEQAHAP